MPFPIQNISFTSAANIPLALPPLIALGFGWPGFGLGISGVNARLGQWLLEQLGEKTGEDMRIRGWCLLDYFNLPVEEALAPLLIECNYRGRRPGEEGWPAM
jgi:1-phosphatidylinositol phosphodiesterase